MASHSNRGKSLEKTVNELFKHYEQKNIFCMRVYEPRTSTGIIYDKSPFDFMVFYNKQIYAFDAKETHGNSINIKGNLKIHQIDALRIIQEQGGIAFFLIYFTDTKELKKISIENVIERIANNQKSIKREECISSKLDFLGVL